MDRRAAVHIARQGEGAFVGRGQAVTVKGPSHRGRSLPMSAGSSSSLMGPGPHQHTVAHVSTRPASSFAVRSACAAASSPALPTPSAAPVCRRLAADRRAAAKPAGGEGRSEVNKKGVRPELSVDVGFWSCC